jgi:molybdopterin-guanine dinucleotide biosynthesis protein A
VPQEQLGHKESREIQALLDHRAFRAMLEQLVPQGHRVFKAMLEQLDHKDHKAPQEPKATKVYRAFKVIQELKALALPCEVM